MDDSHFLRETVVDIDAAVVGISSNRWTAVSEAEATLERASEIMAEHRFDILPITIGTRVTHYFRTSRWNDFSNITKQRITHRDLIPHRTSLREVIKSF